jgi:hypothetical protein
MIAAISAGLNTKATDRAAQVQAEREPSFCQSPRGRDPLIPDTREAHDGPLNYRNNNMATVPAATRRLMAPNASKTECLLFMVVTVLMNSLGAPSFCRIPIIHPRNREPISIRKTGANRMSASWNTKDSG